MLKKSRTGASVNVHLVLRNHEGVLLSLRENTGYCDGWYGLVAGHVENGESALAALIREAYEEVGIQLNIADCKAVHAMHRCSDRFNMDLFFECHTWKGSIVNREPEKCGEVAFFLENRLPDNTIEFVRYALKCISEGVFYSEYGFN